MLKFRDFAKQMKDRVENYRTMSNSQLDDEFGKVDKNGYPCVVACHGGHSKKSKKPAKKVVKEDSKRTTWDQVHDNSHLGADVHEVHKKLMDAYGDRRPSHQAAHNEYTKASQHLNSTLYEHHIFDEKVPDKINAHAHMNAGDHVHNIAALDGALHHKPLEHKLHVYSGVSFNPGELAAKHPDGHIHLPAYTSSTIEKHTAEVFAANHLHDSQKRTHPLSSGHILHIALPKGHPGSYIGNDSYYRHEKEFTVPRNTTLKIHPEPTVHETKYGDKIHVWHATPVAHKPL